MKAVTVDVMRQLDRRTIEEYGVPGEILMERAGINAAEVIIEWLAMLDHHARRVIILTGKGNNGGDAYVVARRLYELTDLNIVILALYPPAELTGEALLHANKTLEETPIKVTEEFKRDIFKPGDVIIDGLLGSGVKGELRPPYDRVIKTVNQLNLPVASLDIPSGMNADDGSGDSIRADLTITIGLPKVGLATAEAVAKCGRLRLVDIGIPASYIAEAESDFDITFACDVQPFFSRLPNNAHKNSCGRVLVIGGSCQYTGAPFLTARAALRGGAGLVTLALPQSVKNYQCDCQALIIRHLPDNGLGYFDAKSIAEIKELIARHDVIVIGPGLGHQRCLIEFIGAVCQTDKPLVIDADALNIIAEVPTLYQEKYSNILTPHPGEMTRLMRAFDLADKLDSGRRQQAAALANAIDSTIVLKGAASVIASPDSRLAVNSSGTPALATAGTGDCLAGLIGACLLNREDCFEAVRAAVFVHGLAGELSRFGNRGLIADDLPELSAMAIGKISPFA